MRRIVHTLFALLLLTGGAGCENGPPWRSGEAEAGVEARRDFGPVAAYDRRLLFLGPGAQLPTAAIFDFAALVDSATVQRGVRARLATGEQWVPLMDDGWAMEGMREPWRIVPRGDLRVIVSGTGEIGAISFRGEQPVRLEPGTLIAESSPDAGTQLVLRQATLSVGDTPLRGILLDAQLGRAIGTAALRQAASDGAVATAPPTPIASAGAEAFLVNNGGYYAVFSTSAGGDLAWVTHAGRDAIHRGVGLEATAWSPAGEGAVQVPEAWRIRGAGLDGELAADAVDRSPLDGLGDLSSLGYILASGWIEDRGVRRDVVGLVRHVR